MKTHEMFPALKRGYKTTAEDVRKAFKDEIRLLGLMVDAAAQAQASGKFRKWTPEKVAREHVKKLKKPPADERHYSPNELAAAWGLSPDTIREIFENEPDVMVIGDKQGTRRKRRYRTIKIPESVAVRVKNRLSSRPAPLKVPPR